MALVIAISFELIVAVQPLVFLAAPVAGALIGFYANQRAERWRPRARVLGNALYAGAVTGVGLAVIYVALRLLSVYADSGFRPVPMGGQLECRTGPDCTFARSESIPLMTSSTAFSPSAAEFAVRWAASEAPCAFLDTWVS